MKAPAEGLSFDSGPGDLLARRLARRDGLLAGAVCLLIATGALLIVYGEAKQALVAGVRLRLLNLAAVAAAEMDPDLHRRVEQTGDLASDDYRRATEPLLRLRTAVPEIYYAYTLVFEGGKPRFVLDTTRFIRNPGDDSPAAPPGEVYADAPAEAGEAWDSGSTVACAEPYTDKWGTFLSAFAPFGGEGRPRGLVGVDISLAEFHARLRPLSWALGVSLAASLAGAVMAGEWRRRGRLRALRSQAELVRAGEAAEAAARAARDADRAKGVFLATMSHEIRTPMNGVLGMAEVLAGMPLGPEQAEHVRTIRQSAGALMGLLNDILDYSKIEAGEQRIAAEPVDLRSLAHETLALFAARAAQQGLALGTEGDGEAPAAVLAEPGRVRQILTNLLSNAVKFTERGEVRVSFSQVRLADGSPAVEVAVRDTGAGIPAEAMGRLFQPFSQVDDFWTRKRGGTGLGLVISRRLAELMGGALTAESAPGGGSCFRLRLPVSSGPAPTNVAPAQTGVARPAAGRGWRILVAEDQPTNRRVLELLLGRLGRTAEFVGDGEAVVARWREIRPEVIFMDVQMPGMDGREATRRIRAEAGAGRPPWIIGLSAGAMPEERAEARAAGMDDFVAKPVSGTALAEALARARAALEAETV